MISLEDQLPLISLGSSGAIPLDPVWLGHLLEAAANAAGYKNWPAEDVAHSVTDFLRNRHAENPCTFEGFRSAVQNVLHGIGYGEVLPYFLMEGLELEFSLLQLVGEERCGFELGFFKACEAACENLLAGGVTRRVLFGDLQPAVKRLLGRRQWTPACARLAMEIVEFLRFKVHTLSAGGCLRFAIR